MVPFDSLTHIHRARIIILGGGVTGTALASYLHSVGNHPALYNDGDAASVLDGDYQLAFVSPGWKKSHPAVEKLLTRGIKIMSELDLAWIIKSERFPEQKWVAVTGTNGKTTTIQMVESILTASTLAGIACGNVGKTVVQALTDGNTYQVLALELSSFQIEWLTQPHFAASAILNIAQDHIDWHGSFAEYAAAKMKLLAHSDCAILNLSDPEVVLRAAQFEMKKIFFGLDTPRPGEIGLVEELFVDRAFVATPDAAETFAQLNDLKPIVPHQALNAMAAAAITLALGISHDEVHNGLLAFEPDRHRMEEVLVKDGITWIDDSKATNPHAAQASLLSHFGVIWIAGGLAKGAAMEELVERAVDRLAAVLLIGQDRELIASALDRFAPNVPYFRIDSPGSSEELMEQVVQKAKELAVAENVVLLAPACASMDQFTSYAHRGEAFASAVAKWV
jgi:UDP-N-acetylmuramoylalanine--D-glutamate ligase